MRPDMRRYQGSILRLLGSPRRILILADHVLRRRELNTVLVHIRMAGMVAHAVCYVNEDRACLDYNNRNVFFTLSRSSPSLREIATKVVRSPEGNWTTASSFTYSYATGQKQMLHTIAKTDPPELDDRPREQPGEGSRLLPSSASGRVCHPR